MCCVESSWASSCPRSVVCYDDVKQMRNSFRFFQRLGLCIIFTCFTLWLCERAVRLSLTSALWLASLLSSVLTSCLCRRVLGDSKSFWPRRCFFVSSLRLHSRLDVWPSDLLRLLQLISSPAVVSGSLELLEFCVFCLLASMSCDHFIVLMEIKLIIILFSSWRVILMRCRYFYPAGHTPETHHC